MSRKEKHIVVLTGAGISAESGLSTFRDNNGLWDKYNVYEVATPEAWQQNPRLVLDFYNERRKQMLAAKPNKAHKLLADLEKDFSVDVITQNIDDLHERAGSTNVLHLHGELKKARSTFDERIVVDIKGEELTIGDKCPLGSQLRPHVVWFGEAVPAMSDAIKIAEKADIFLIVGTSLNVYPAAGLVDFTPETAKVIVVDPEKVKPITDREVMHIKKKATEGVAEAIDLIKTMA